MSGVGGSHWDVVYGLPIVVVVVGLFLAWLRMQAVATRRHRDDWLRRRVDWGAKPYRRFPPPPRGGRR